MKVCCRQPPNDASTRGEDGNEEDEAGEAMNLASNWRKLGLRSWPERALLLEAAGGLVFARFSIGLLRFQSIARLLGLVPEQEERRAKEAPKQHGSSETPSAEAAGVETVIQIGWAVRTVAAQMRGRGTCLVQTLAGAAMLRRRGIPCSLSLGIARDGTGYAAHAWLCSGNVILTGAPGHKRFTPISDFVAPRTAASSEVFS